ncbi:DNA cytosine methyltransferase [Patescibacteria group bacterium]|nr:DNA cytosine methyltransferase [Patescibacteria group bacterium]
MKKYSVISLFTGCGGLDLGFVGGFTFLNKFYPKNNFEMVWANDIDKASCQTFRKNFGHEIVCGDITQLLNGNHSPSLLEEPLPKHADVVLGGFPCQDFSHAGKRRGFTSKRGLLYQSMVEVVKKTDPLIFVAENVKGLMTMDDGDALKIIIKDFEELGYDVVYKLLTAADYGVPQIRERVIIVGTKKNIVSKFKYPKPTLNKESWVTLKRAIGDMENIKEGEVDNHFWSKAKMFPGTQGNTIVSPNKPGPTMRTEHHGNIEWHWNEARRLSAREAARIQSFPDNFIFYPSTSAAYKQIGNAVPPVMAWHIAKSVESLLNKHYSTD